MSASHGRVVVVGGGVIGASCAYFLNRAGYKVTVLDKGEFGQACSHANCGYVSPSHVLPLATPGAIGTGLKALFQKEGPLSIRWRLDPALWGWLIRFALRCNTRDMLASGHAIQALLDSSRSLYEQILRDESIECEWETKGMLFVLATQHGMEHFAETDKLLSETFSRPAKRFDGAALNDLEPALKPGLPGGWLYPGDAHLRPDRLMSEWRRVLQQRGVEIREGVSVERVHREGGIARSVATATEKFEGEAFVFATGAWTPQLAKQIGCRVPIQPGKGYSITMPRPARCPVHPIIFEEHRVAVTPMQSGYRLGSTMEFAGYDTKLNPRRLTLLRESARHYLHEPEAEPVQEEWYGWRPMTYDGKPLIGRSPTIPNVLTAAGHNMLGVSMAPATGRLVAELLQYQTPHIDPEPYNPGRFS